MPSRLLERLTERIRQLRKQRGLTQEAFAEKAAISYKYYQAIEAGRRADLRLSTLERLAKAHDLESWELLLPEMPSGGVAQPRARHGKSRRAARRSKK